MAIDQHISEDIMRTSCVRWRRHLEGDQLNKQPLWLFATLK